MYKAAEDNEIDLTEGEMVQNIEMIDESWWSGTNSHGQTGYFPGKLS